MVVLRAPQYSTNNSQVKKKPSKKINTTRWNKTTILIRNIFARPHRPHGTSALRFPLFSTRMANSNATNVAPLANGDRINVGINPLENALIPSVAHTDRMHWVVEAYF